MTGAPSKQSVNVLYLVIMILLLIAGSALQVWSAHWGLILTEVLLIFLPAWLLLRLQKLPVGATVRLGWPGGAAVGLSILMGIGLAPVAMWLADLASQWFGYTIWVTPDFYPTNLLQAALFLFALAVAAPLCEEFLFRGLIQRAYEGRSMMGTVISVGLLFAAFHLSLQRFFLIIPVALALSFVAWRARSLWASIALHFGYNLVAGVISVVSSLAPHTPLEQFVSWQAMGAGLVLATGALWAFIKLVPAPEMTATAAGGEEFGAQPAVSELPGQASPVPAASRRRSNPVLAYWPIVVAVPVFAVVSLGEVVLGRFPELLARSAPAFQVAPWQAAQQWEYELRAADDKTVGQATCDLSPEGEAYQLLCTVDVEAFTASIPGSYFQTDGYLEQINVTWGADDLFIQQAEVRRDNTQAGYQLSLEATAGGLSLQSRGETLDLPAETLLTPEWAWRGMALDFGIGQAYHATLLWPSRWSEEAGQAAPQSEAATLVVLGAEPLGVPAGGYITWKVALGSQSAWYDSLPPHVLVQYSDDFVTWVLVAEHGGER